jgi:hypothetical protein
MFKATIAAAFVAGANLCIDECLYPFRGRCVMRQYMPAKPAKYGIKWFCLCDVATSYLLEVNIYLGKEINQNENTKGSARAVVEALLSSYHGTRRLVCMDNWFTSVPLAISLYFKKLLILGTVRENKSEVPLEFKKSRARELFSSLFGFHGFMSLCSYVSKKGKAVLLLSTQHHSSNIGHDGMIGCLKEKENAKAEKQVVKKKPQVVLEYNKYKGYPSLKVDYQYRKFVLFLLF